MQGPQLLFLKLKGWTPRCLEQGRGGEKGKGKREGESYRVSVPELICP